MLQMTHAQCLRAFPPSSIFLVCLFLGIHQPVSAVDPISDTSAVISSGQTAQSPEEAAFASFDVFTKEWMAKLSQTEEFQRTKKMKVIRSAEGFTAEYVGYLPDRHIVVRKTKSKETPFVGILTYFQKTLKCTGTTKEQARQGPFHHINTKQVSEIFRFTRGKWRY